jgi:hypothetical protein
MKGLHTVFHLQASQYVHVSDAVSTPSQLAHSRPLLLLPPCHPSPALLSSILEFQQEVELEADWEQWSMELALLILEGSLDVTKSSKEQNYAEDKQRNG